MKKLFNLFICLLLCFSFSNFVYAEETHDVDTDNNYDVEEEYPEDEEDYPEDEEDYPEDEWDYTDDESEWPEGEEEDPTYEGELEADSNVENSQTSDIPIILISIVAIVSLIVVLSKKNTFINNRI